jgi:hypothetical protein
MKLKKLLILILPLALIIGFFVYRNFSISKNPKDVVTITATAPSTVFDLLKSTSKITYKTYSFGTMVESINGLKNTPELAWIFYVNGQSASVGADQYQLQPGDVVEWKYVKPQF